MALVVRPEHVLLGDQGPFIRYRLDLGGQTVVAESTNRADRAVLEDRAEVAVAWQPDDSEILPD